MEDLPTDQGPRNSTMGLEVISPSREREREIVRERKREREREREIARERKREREKGGHFVDFVNGTLCPTRGRSLHTSCYYGLSPQALTSLG
jgi:hypothetical protein